MSLFRPGNSKFYHYEFVYQRQRFRATTGMTSITRAREVEAKRKQQLRESHAGIRREPLKPAIFSVAFEAWFEAEMLRRAAAVHALSDVDEREREQELMKATRYNLLACKGHLQKPFGKRLLVDIDGQDITRYQQSRQWEKAANRTINREVEVIRKLLKKHKLWGRIADDVKMLPVPEDIGYAITPDEEQLLLRACAQSRSRLLLPFVALLLVTGARFGTLKRLRWSQIDLESRVLRLGIDKTKYSSRRIVPLSQRAELVLRSWAKEFPKRQPRDYVFPREKSNGAIKEVDGVWSLPAVTSCDPTKHVSTMRSAWRTAKRLTRRYCPACATGTLVDIQDGFSCLMCGYMTHILPNGLPKLRLHDLRHTAVSRMIAAKIPLPMIAKIVGWSSATLAYMVARYEHYTLDDLRTALETINAAWSKPPEEQDDHEGSRLGVTTVVRRSGYDREKLYEDAWSMPLIKLAEGYGVSAVAIGKACRRMGVPLPGRGYWNKKLAGLPLPPRPQLLS